MSKTNIKKITVAISGGFDPIHVGHIELIQEAAKLGDRLIVIVNEDIFLIKKKGYVFMPLAERKTILESIKGVDEVVVAVDEDESVAKTIELIKPDIFANGGDRTTANPKENIACEGIGCKQVFRLGAKIQSSSKLVRRAEEQNV